MYEVPSAWGTPVERLNPWTNIWTRPRATMRGILATDPTRHVIFLAAVSGAAGSLGNVLESHFTGNRSLPLMAGLFIAFLLGPLFGVLGLYLSAALVRWTGSWLGGVATPDEARAAVAWATVPTLWGMLLWLPILATGGRVDAVLTLVGLAQVVVSIWTFVISLKCLGEAHRFSAWKALGAEILAGLVVLVPLACLAFALIGR